MKEVEAAGERIQSVYGIFSAPAVVGGTGQMTTEFEVFARHSYVSHVKHQVFFRLGQGIRLRGLQNFSYGSISMKKMMHCFP